MTRTSRRFQFHEVSRVERVSGRFLTSLVGCIDSVNCNREHKEAVLREGNEFRFGHV